MNIILLFFSLKYKGDWDKIYDALQNKERVTIHEIQTLEKKIKKEHITYFTILDKFYPEIFKTVYMWWPEKSWRIINMELNFLISINYLEYFYK